MSSHYPDAQEFELARFLIAMDTESLLHEELKDGIFSSEPSISEDEAYDNIAPVSRCLRWKRYIYSPLAYGIVTFVYSLILIVVVIEMQALRLKGPGLIDCKS